jgi:ankyrin repeat protein
MSNSLHCALYVLLDKALDETDWLTAKTTSMALFSIFGKQANIPNAIISWALGRYRFQFYADRYLLDHINDTKEWMDIFNLNVHPNSITEDKIMCLCQCIDGVVAAVHSGATVHHRLTFVDWLVKTCRTASYKSGSMTNFHTVATLRNKTFEALRTYLRFGGNAWIFIHHLMGRCINKMNNNHLENDTFLEFVKITVEHICLISDVNAELHRETPYCSISALPTTAPPHTLLTAILMADIDPYKNKGLMDAVINYIFKQHGNLLLTRDVFHIIAENVNLSWYFFLAPSGGGKLRKIGRKNEISRSQQEEPTWMFDTTEQRILISSYKLHSLLNDKNHSGKTPLEVLLSKRDDGWMQDLIWDFVSRFIVLGATTKTIAPVLHVIADVEIPATSRQRCLVSFQRQMLGLRHYYKYLKQPFLKLSRERETITPLMKSSLSNLKFFLNFVDPMLTDSNGNTFLHWIALRGGIDQMTFDDIAKHHPSFVQMLKKVLLCKNHHDELPLAVWRFSKPYSISSAIKMLELMDDKINGQCVRDKSGVTLCHKLVEGFLEMGRGNAPDSFGWNESTLCTSGMFVTINARDKNGRTPFMYALGRGTYKDAWFPIIHKKKLCALLDLLFRFGADGLAVDIKGDTAIHIAVDGICHLNSSVLYVTNVITYLEKYHRPLLLLLLSRKNFAGHTPFDIFKFQLDRQTKKVSVTQRTLASLLSVTSTMN